MRFFNSEHFPAKWAPLRVAKTRQNKMLEPFSDSIESENALATFRRKEFSWATKCGQVLRLIMGSALVGGILLAPGQVSFAANELGTPADHREKGEIIAKRWCAACHLVAPDQTKANPDVPSFKAIARKVKSPKALAAFLTDPHPKMPDMNLTRGEIEDLVAYIGSLEK